MQWKLETRERPSLTIFFTHQWHYILTANAVLISYDTSQFYNLSPFSAFPDYTTFDNTQFHGSEKQQNWKINWVILRLPCQPLHEIPQGQLTQKMALIAALYTMNGCPSELGWYLGVWNHKTKWQIKTDSSLIWQHTNFERILHQQQARL